MVENKKSKAKRMVAFAIIGLLVTLFISAAAGGAAQAAASTQTHTLVLGSDSAISYAWGENNSSGVFSALPISTISANGTGANGTYSTTVTNGFSVVKVAGANNTTSPKEVYDLVNILSTNMTLGQMNTYAVNKVVFATTGISGNITAVLGSGTSYKDFVTIALITLNSNGTAQNLSFKISPSMITGNASQDLMLKLEFSSANTPASYSVNSQVTGVASTTFGYATAEDVAYVVGTALLIVSTFFVIPFHDFTVVGAWGKMTSVKKSKGTRRKTKSNKRRK